MNFKKKPNIFLTTGIIAVAFLGFSAYWNYLYYSEDDEVTTDSVQIQNKIGINNVIIPDQAVSGEIFIERALFKTEGDGGYVVIHRTDEEGAPTDIIGASDYVSPGVSENFIVTLNEGETVEVGEELVAMLHSDGGDQTWDAALDAPTRDENGNVVMTMFSILAEEDIPGFEQKL